jgi:uncharacterized membrane protein YgcG
VAPAPDGEILTAGDRRSIVKAVRSAESQSGCDFSVLIEAAESDARAYAEELHAGLDNAPNSVLVFVDPVARQLEIVTGSTVRRFLGDSEVALAALHMQTSFAAGDFVGGITQGVQQLADHARRPRTLHFHG